MASLAEERTSSRFPNEVRRPKSAPATSVPKKSRNADAKPAQPMMRKPAIPARPKAPITSKELALESIEPSEEEIMSMDPEKAKLHEALLNFERSMEAMFIAFEGSAGTDLLEFVQTKMQRGVAYVAKLARDRRAQDKSVASGAGVAWTVKKPSSAEKMEKETWAVVARPTVDTRAVPELEKYQWPDDAREPDPRLMGALEPEEPFRVDTPISQEQEKLILSIAANATDDGEWQSQRKDLKRARKQQRQQEYHGAYRPPRPGKENTVAPLVSPTEGASSATAPLTQATGARHNALPAPRAPRAKDVAGASVVVPPPDAAAPRGVARGARDASSVASEDAGAERTHDEAPAASGALAAPGKADGPLAGVAASTKGAKRTPSDAGSTTSSERGSFASVAAAAVAPGKGGRRAPKKVVTKSPPAAGATPPPWNSSPRSSSPRHTSPQHSSRPASRAVAAPSGTPKGAPIRPPKPESSATASPERLTRETLHEADVELDGGVRSRLAEPLSPLVSLTQGRMTPGSGGVDGVRPSEDGFTSPPRTPHEAKVTSPDEISRGLQQLREGGKKWGDVDLVSPPMSPNRVPVHQRLAQSPTKSKSAEERRLTIEEKQQRAAENKAVEVQKRQNKAAASNKAVETTREKFRVETAKKAAQMEDKQKNVADRRDAVMNERKAKASDEGNKVEEVRHINKEVAETAVFILQDKIFKADARVAEMKRKKEEEQAKKKAKKGLPSPAKELLNCRVCNIALPEGVSRQDHLESKAHKKKAAQLGEPVDEAQALTPQPVPVTTETVDEAEVRSKRQKAHRKKVKTVQDRIAKLADGYQPAARPEPEPDGLRTAVKRTQSAVERLRTTIAEAAWDDALTELEGIRDRAKFAWASTPLEPDFLFHTGTLDVLVDTIKTRLDALPPPLLRGVLEVLKLACNKSAPNQLHVLMRAGVLPLLKLFNTAMASVDPDMSLVVPLVSALGLFFQYATDRTSAEARMIHDLTIVAAYTGVVDRIVHRLMLIPSLLDGPMDASSPIYAFLLGSLAVLSRIYSTAVDPDRAVYAPVEDSERKTVIAALPHTDIVSAVVAFLNAILLRNGPQREIGRPEVGMVAVFALALRVLNRIACLDLKTLQTCLETLPEGTGVYLLFTNVMAYCAGEHEVETSPLLLEAMLLMGYNALNNPAGQAVLGLGRSPTIMQRLCNLPFSYFSDPKLQEVLFPTLICGCFGDERNVAVMEQAISSELLVTYLRESTDEQPSQVDVEPRVRFRARFPPDRVEDAREFFSSRATKS